MPSVPGRQTKRCQNEQSQYCCDAQVPDEEEEGCCSSLHVVCEGIFQCWPLLRECDINMASRCWRDCLLLLLLRAPVALGPRGEAGRGMTRLSSTARLESTPDKAETTSTLVIEGLGLGFGLGLWAPSSFPVHKAKRGRRRAGSQTDAAGEEMHEERQFELTAFLCRSPICKARMRKRSRRRSEEKR